MRKRMIQLIFALLGIGAGYSLMPMVWRMAHVTSHWVNNIFIDMVVGLAVFVLISFFVIDPLERLVQKIERFLTNEKPEKMIPELVSTVIGLVIAVLISLLFTNSQLFFLNTILPFILVILFAYLGFIVGQNRFNELRKLFGRHKKNVLDGSSDQAAGEMLERKAGDNFHKYKLLDTNILIDGRIYDLVQTGFLEGILVVPNFVLYELQYIADSGDSVKRVRGRRGLDILNKLREEKVMPVQMYDGDFDDIQEVDSKLLKLAKMIDAVVVTNDYNLNKVAEFQNVQVLNVNALAKSLKPRVIPGENLNVMIIKKGTERQQGVAYLDDGTMIVVEDGQYYMNQKLSVEVTSALQTDAGRMIFAKPVHSKRGIREKN
ncbi:PIN/TRAM domain-containing protein [Ligilactobacillus pabuli]|uniref:PIN/TRAM domain-containing protein n=1 Tax=Ligilactobacillus pabuli TaxID=2886039 RepID=A0ABQ5JG12_9LACO|nr:PIN domain-containing protein [Ligilactobacillus pabuli]GKS80643.1 PIN/TRAM domain-containing protein [Ligilactobacillus pabuli]HIW88514.1 PIN domain nuclease [Candidatus Ligilactobacillus excrementipullorum]